MKRVRLDMQLLIVILLSFFALNSENQIYAHSPSEIAKLARNTAQLLIERDALRGALDQALVQHLADQNIYRNPRLPNTAKAQARLTSLNRQIAINFESVLAMQDNQTKPVQYGVINQHVQTASYSLVGAWFLGVVMGGDWFLTFLTRAQSSGPTQIALLSLFATPVAAMANFFWISRKSPEEGPTIYDKAYRYLGDFINNCYYGETNDAVAFFIKRLASDYKPLSVLIAAYGSKACQSFLLNQGL